MWSVYFSFSLQAFSSWCPRHLDQSPAVSPECFLSVSLSVSVDGDSFRSYRLKMVPVGVKYLTTALICVVVYNGDFWKLFLRCRFFKNPSCFVSMWMCKTKHLGNDDITSFIHTCQLLHCVMSMHRKQQKQWQFTSTSVHTRVTFCTVDCVPERCYVMSNMYKWGNNC